MEQVVISETKCHLTKQVSHRGGPGSNLDLLVWDFVMDKSGAGAAFLRELGFPCQSTFHLLPPNHLHYHPRLAQ
jgi:hypothetical protein